MKKLLFILCSVLIITGCSKEDGEMFDNNKMHYKATNRTSRVIELEDNNLQKKHIQIMDPDPGNRNPWAYDAYCPNPTHKGKVPFGMDIAADYPIFCSFTCGLAYSNKGNPLNDYTKKSKIRIKFYNIIYDESISSYVIWE